MNISFQLEHFDYSCH